MDRGLILEHLHRAERHIASARKKITEQIEFIAWLNWFRKDATGAKGLLRDFERRLAAHATDRERLRAQLAYLAPASSTREQQTRPIACRANACRRAFGPSGVPAMTASEWTAM